MASYNYKMASENVEKLNLSFGFYSIADAKWLKVTNLNMIYESQRNREDVFLFLKFECMKLSSKLHGPQVAGLTSQSLHGYYPSGNERTLLYISR